MIETNITTTIDKIYNIIKQTITLIVTPPVAGNETGLKEPLLR